MDLIIENLPPHFDDAKRAAKRLEEAAISQRKDEEEGRAAIREAKRLEKEEKKKLAEAEKQGKPIEQVKEEIQQQITTKKPKTKVGRKIDKDGFLVPTVVDVETGKEIKVTQDKVPDKKEVEITPEKKSKKTAPEQPTADEPNKSLFYIDEEEDSVPTPAQFQDILKEAKRTGQKNKKPKYPTHAPKPGDKVKKEKTKKPTEEKVAVLHVPKKQFSAPPAQQPTDVPFFQNELVKPLVYVVALVSLLSVIYLIMS